MTRYNVRSSFSINSYVTDRAEAERLLVEDFGNAYPYFSEDEVSKVIVLTNRGVTVYLDEVEISDFIRCGCSTGIKNIAVYDKDGELIELFTIMEIGSA